LYTGFWLALKSMTLDNLECQNRGFYGFFGDFKLWDTFQERIVPKSIVIDKDKLHNKFSSSNVDFNGPSLDFLGSRKPAHEGIKEQYPRKSLFYLCWPVFHEISCRLPWACCLSQQVLVTSFLVVSSSMTLKDPELPKYGVLLIFAIFGCSAHFKSELRRNGWRLTDSLQTGTAIGFLTSLEH